MELRRTRAARAREALSLHGGVAERRTESDGDARGADASQATGSGWGRGVRAPRARPVYVSVARAA
eukprot:179666-Prymnesium_polylepis.2